MTTITANLVEKQLLAGELWTVGHTFAAVAAGATVQFGIRIGARPVVYQARTYGGTTTQLEVKLYKDVWSAGTAVAARNRNLAIALPGPATYAHSVTGTPTNFETGINFYSSGVGNSPVGQVPEGEWYMLLPDTDYILTLKNAGAAPGDINFRFTYRATGT